MHLTPRRGLGFGCLASVVIVLLLIGIFLGYSLRSYDGTCPSFEPPARVCSFPEFLVPAIFLVLLFAIVTKPLLAAAILLLIIALPPIGYLFGKRASSS